MLIPSEGGTEVLDRTATLQRATREFTELYERKAYVTYNLTLRITCDRARAVAAASSSFLNAATTPDGEAGLVKTATSQALALTATGRPEPNGAGDAEAQAMLEATAGLAPPERAALALQGLVEAGPPEIAAAMNLTEHAATTVLSRSFERLAAALGKSREEAEKAYGAWLWAEPPAELWEDLYPSFYRHVERQIREVADEDGKATSKGPSRRERRRLKRAGRERRRLPRPGRRTIVAVALVALGAGGGVVASGTGLLGGGDDGPREPTLQPEASFGGNLSPEKLDELRLRELERAAGAGALDEEEIEDKPGDDPKTRKAKARKRKQRAELLELRRKRAARKRELRERASRAPSSPAPSPARTPDRRPEPREEPKRETKPKDEKKDDERSIDDCLYNASSGTYVCPEEEE
jgi:hypothetical protein